MRTLLLRSLASFVAPPRSVPALLDTAIGTDIDDAYALAVISHRPEAALLRVTTVSSDAVAPARLAQNCRRCAWI